MAGAAELIAALGLARHPEGGWYRESWRVPASGGGRDTATAILFLLPEGEVSHWHRVDADEVWFWHAGAPLLLSMAATEAGPARRLRLGPDVLSGEVVQAIVPADHWQSARSTGGFSLLSCVVSPGFSFDGFTLAPPGFDILGG